MADGYCQDFQGSVIIYGVLCAEEWNIETCWIKSLLKNSVRKYDKSIKCIHLSEQYTFWIKAIKASKYFYFSQNHISIFAQSGIRIYKLYGILFQSPHDVNAKSTWRRLEASYKKENWHRVKIDFPLVHTACISKICFPFHPDNILCFKLLASFWK